MGTKKHRMTVGLDSEDMTFFQEMQRNGIFQKHADAIRWCVKFCRLYGIPGIKRIRALEKDTPAAGGRRDPSPA